MTAMAGKVALVTGATGGIGQAVARAFLDAGACVMLVSRTEDKLASVAAALSGGDSLAVCAADISSEEDTRRFIGETVQRFGGVDVLFANAGFEGSIKPMVELEQAEFDQVLQTNVRGTWLSIKHAAPAMSSRGGGAIVVSSSVAGLVGVAGLGAYSASKHALIGLVQVAAQELAESKVRVNAVAPAPVDNDMMRSIEQQAVPGQPEAARAGFAALNPMNRYATNEEVAALVAFLASDAASFCNGAVYPVDGGFLAQ